MNTRAFNSAFAALTTASRISGVTKEELIEECLEHEVKRIRIANSKKVEVNLLNQILESSETIEAARHKSKTQLIK